MWSGVLTAYILRKLGYSNMASPSSTELEAMGVLDEDHVFAAVHVNMHSSYNFLASTSKHEPVQMSNVCSCILRSGLHFAKQMRELFLFV